MGAPAMQAQRAALSDGRWHFQHGPIDLVIGADGDAPALAAAHAAAWQRFETVLTELVAELPLLRRPVRGPCPLQGVIARRMWWACHPFHSVYITPMAAVAGAVAQELIGAYARDGVQRAWINNGGDIALHLAEGTSVNVGVIADISGHAPFGLTAPAPTPFGLTLRQAQDRVHDAHRSLGAAWPFDTSGRTESGERTEQAGRTDSLDGRFTVDASMPVRGIATSGWRGRSFSLGIADSVTVLAKTAAMADAAATIIANAVDIDDPCIERRAANELKDDSDLGELLVTVDVPALPADTVAAALERGRRRAHDLQRDGLIHSALLVCQQQAARADPALAIRVDTDIAGRRVGSVFA
jgi:ApbE superfamily uncharacterized protein (UPF0280 family)